MTRPAPIKPTSPAAVAAESAPPETRTRPREPSATKPLSRTTPVRMAWEVSSAMASILGTRYTAPLLLSRGLLISIALVGIAALVPATAGACVGKSKTPRKLSEQVARQAVLCLINQRRAHAGLGTLQENANLDNSAQGHTVAMGKHNSYFHGKAASRVRDT